MYSAKTQRQPDLTATRLRGDVIDQILGDKGAMRFRVQKIHDTQPGNTPNRWEWLFTPPGNVSPRDLFEFAAGDPRSADMEREIIEAGLQWRERVGAPLAINLSVTALADAGFSSWLRERLMTVDMGQIWWEITELRPPHLDNDRIASTVSGLRLLGERIVADDIESLADLADFVAQFGVPHVVKIAAPVLKEPTSILLALAQEVRRIGAHLTVEGVESVTDRELVERAGARYWQGFLLGQPEAVPPAPVIAETHSW